jgi:hypothetical protein
MRAGCGVDELRSDPSQPLGVAYAAFEDVVDLELLSHLPDIDGLAFVREARVASDNCDPILARQGTDDLFHQAVSKKLVLWIEAEAFERQNGHRRLDGADPPMLGVGNRNRNVEQVPALRNGLDDLLALVAQRASDLTDANGQGFISHGYARPNRFHHFCLAYDPACTFHQVSQHFEALGPQAHLTRRSTQTEPIQVEGEAGKPNRPGRHHSRARRIAGHNADASTRL